MTAKYPLLLEPSIKEVVWGGRWLAETLGRPGAEDARLGESWEAFSGSRIVNGAWQGQTLGDVFTRHKARWAGTAADACPKFPLLVKFIDARENLSIQVHPDDDLAQQLENYPYGKTEFWYVLEAAPDAHIYYGLNKRGMGREELQAALQDGDLLRHLKQVPVRAGDVVYMPAGTVHALTAGVVVYELQQDSDITYRLYDWGRADRAIHLDKGLQSIDAACADLEVTRPAFAGTRDAQTATLVACSFFRSEIWRITRSLPVAAHADSFTLLTAITGSGSIVSDAQEFASVPLKRGTTVCLPAGLAYTLRRDANEEDAALEVISGRLTPVERGE